MAGCATEVDKTAFGEEDDVTAILHEIAVNLGLDVCDGLGVSFQPSNVNFNVEMADIWSNWSDNRSKL